MNYKPDDREQVYLEQNMIKFSSVLRNLGFRIGTSEIAETISALEHIPLLDKRAVKAALRATLVKETTKAPLFDRAFELFFTLPESLF